MKQLRLGLYLITGTYPELGRGHMDIARAALEGGADTLQIREKDAGRPEVLRIALEMRDLLDKSGSECLLLVNDLIDVAIESQADGVHVGQEDLDAGAARSMCGPAMLLGVSASSVEEAKKAEEEGADYLGVGPIFATPTKPDAGAPIGLEGLREIRETVELPLVAIGGINEDNAGWVFEAGADGIAVISAVATAKDMLGSIRGLRRLADSYAKGR